MGKTKTAFVGGAEEGQKKPSYDKAAKEAKRKEKGLTQAPVIHEEVKKKPVEKPDMSALPAQAGQAGKVHVSGLKGGQRIKTVEAEMPETVKPVEEKVAKKQKKTRSRGKKYSEARKKIDKNKLYSAADAIKLIKETSYSKFDGTVEVHAVVKKVGISANVTLPFSFGAAKKVEVADDKTIEKLQKNKIDFDILLATPDMMPKLVPFAKLLGPKGLMPNPKNGTLIKDAKDVAGKNAAEKFSSNKVLTLKTEREAPIIHASIGKVSQKDAELQENIKAIIKALDPKQILKFYLKATMSPSVKVTF